jgi:cytochrome c551
MQTVKLIFVFAALLVGAAACGNNAAPDPTANARPTATVAPAPAATASGAADEFATVRADYAQFCINCHKADGTGGPRQLEDGGTLKVPSLREEGRKDTDEHLAEQIRDGGGGMPPFKNRLDDKRINDLVRFIRKEFHGRDAGAPAR